MRHINLNYLNNEFLGFRKFDYMHGGMEGHGGSESPQVNEDERDIVEVDEKEFEAIVRARAADAEIAEKLVRSDGIAEGASIEELRNELRRIVGEKIGD